MFIRLSRRNRWPNSEKKNRHSHALMLSKPTKSAREIASNEYQKRKEILPKILFPP
jgi:hypothetical protein